MQTKLIEATNGINWGKFLLGRLDTEWSARSAMSDATPIPLLRQVGMAPDQMLVLDLQTCEGALFSVRPGGLPQADLTKHQIWVCPMFQPFLTWLYLQDVSDLDALPHVVELAAPAVLGGYRRPGVVGHYLVEHLKDDIEALADDPIPIQEELLDRWRELRLIAMTVGFDVVGHLLETATDFELERLRGLGVPE